LRHIRKLLGIRIPRLYAGLMRRVLVRRNWPRPEHIDRMSPRVFNAYLTATGFDADVRESLAERQGGSDQGGAVTSLRTAQERDSERGGAPVA